VPTRLVPVAWDSQPREAGVIAAPYRRSLLLVADAGVPVPQFCAQGNNRQIKSFTRGAGNSGSGYNVTSTSDYPRGRAQDDASDQALIEIPASSDWTMQFIVERIGTSGANAGFTRSNGGGTGTTFIIQDGSTRRPWVRVNSVDILRPGSGAQWTTGQKLNLIVRFRNASLIEAWWDSKLQHTASHSTSQDALTVAASNAIYAWATQGQGGSGAEVTTGNHLGWRAWSRFLDDQEMQALARDELALYEPRCIWVPVSAGGSVAVAAATETDTAQPIASNQAASVGLASETDTAIAIALTQRATLGLASETDTAQALTSNQAGALGLASETDTAQPVSSGTIASVGLASETDTAQALASNQSATIGLAAETDSAQPISVTGAGTLGTATETDTAQALTANQRGTIGLASETDTAQPISRVEFITVGLASETDTAQPIVSLQRAAIAPALETDTAQAISITGGEPPAPATPTFQPGYKHNPRTARDLDPLPPTGDDLADLVRDKWDAIERANAAIKRARGGDAPAQVVVAPTPPAPAPRPTKRRAGAIAAAGLPLTDEQLRADEEAFILMVAEIL